MRSIGAKRRAARRWTNWGLRPPASLAPYAYGARTPPRAPPAPRLVIGEASSSASCSASASSSRRRRGDEEEQEALRKALAASVADLEEKKRREEEDLAAAIAAVETAKRQQELEEAVAGIRVAEEAGTGAVDDMEVDVIVID